MLKYSLKTGYEDATFGEPKLTSAKMSYSGPDPTNANNYAVTLELTFEPLAITNYDGVPIETKGAGEAIHNLVGRQVVRNDPQIQITHGTRSIVLDNNRPSHSFQWWHW